MQTQQPTYSNGKKNFVSYLAYDDKRQGPRRRKSLTGQAMQKQPGGTPLAVQ